MRHGNGLVRHFLRLILGERRENTASPELLKKEYLALTVATSILLVILTIIADLANGLGQFNWTNILGVAILSFSLLYLHLDYYQAAVNLFFFGGVASILVGIGAHLIFASQSSIYLPLAALILFSAIAFVGLFSGSKLNVILMTAIALLFDVLVFWLDNSTALNILYYHIGMGFLHILAAAMGLFQVRYFDHLSRITEARRLMNRNLEALISQTQSSNIRKLHSISHDIRSPITAIMGVQALLASTPLSEEQQRYLDILTRSNRLLLDIVESILDSDKEDGGGNYPIRRLFDLVLDPFRSLARAKGVELQKQIHGNPPPISLSRASAIRVLANLVDNALKYTDSGSILISAAVGNKDCDQKVLRITVTDTGRGMSLERLETVRSGLNERDSEIGSSRGLGLPGVRRLVAEAKGTFDIQSVAGEGTTVTLTFPMKE